MTTEELTHDPPHDNRKTSTWSSTWQQKNEHMIPPMTTEEQTRDQPHMTTEELTHDPPNDKRRTNTLSSTWQKKNKHMSHHTWQQKNAHMILPKTKRRTERRGGLLYLKMFWPDYLQLSGCWSAWAGQRWWRSKYDQKLKLHNKGRDNNKAKKLNKFREFKRAGHAPTPSVDSGHPYFHIKCKIQGPTDSR